MRFSLLTPPTDAPSRIPLSRGLPSAGALNVDTGGLPRTLPVAALDVDAVTLPFQSMAKMAASGLHVASDVSNLVLEAEAKKRDANDAAEIDRMNTSLTQNVDTSYEKMKLTETDETLVPKFNAMWKAEMDAHLAQASNPRVAAGFTAKANQLLRAKSGEVTTATTKKFIARQRAEFENAIDAYTDQATDPLLSRREQAVAVFNLEQKFLSGVQLGIYDANDMAKMRREKMDGITLERAHTEAYLNPEGFLENASKGETYDLSSKQFRSMVDVATNQLRMQRNDREYMQKQEAKRLKDAQDDAALTLRREIVENWSPGGAKTSMVSRLNQNARRVGDDNYKSLLETERTYQHLATQPGPKKPSDPDLKGELQKTLTSDSWRDVTQADLLRLMKTGLLNDDDHRYFSNKLAELHEKAKHPDPETPAQKERKQQITDAAKGMRAFIERGSKFEAQPSEILQAEAEAELKRLADLHPDMHPRDIATKLIAQRIASYRDLLDGLPYKTREDVQKAAALGMPRAEAERYYAIFDLFEKTQPTKPQQQAPQSWGDWFKGLLPGGGGTPTPAPTGPSGQPIRPPKSDRKRP